MLYSTLYHQAYWIEMLFQTLLIVAACFSIANAAYIRRDEYTWGSNCTESARFKSAYYYIGVCAPPSNVKYTYNPTSATPISVQYFGDSACLTDGGSTSTFGAGVCIHGTSTDYSHTYLDALPALASSETTYAIYDRSQSACSGALYYLVQATPLCYLNADGSFKSASTVCSGTQQTLVKCTDTSCTEGCTSTISDLNNVCSTQDHDINSCGSPVTGVSGAGSDSSSTGNSPSSGSTFGGSPSSGTPSPSGSLFGGTSTTANVGASTAAIVPISVSFTVLATILVFSVILL